MVVASAVTRSADEWQERYGLALCCTFPPLGDRARERWSVIVRGTDEHALRDWDARRRWAGRVEIPLAELLDRGAAPASAEPFTR